MSSALSVTLVDRMTAATISPGPRSSLRPSMRPTHVPGSFVSAPRSGIYASETPVTQRSAVSPPRSGPASALAHHDLIAFIRANIDLLTSLIQDDAASNVLAALDDVRLERVAALAPPPTT